MDFYLAEVHCQGLTFIPGIGAPLYLSSTLILLTTSKTNKKRAYLSQACGVSTRY